jgi:plasmid stabilization system protein ParE
MTQAIFHPAARRELEEAIDHYNAERQGLGREFREEVQRVLALLTRFLGLGNLSEEACFSTQTISVFWLSHTIVEGQSTGVIGSRTLITACRRRRTACAARSRCPPRR